MVETLRKINAELHKNCGKYNTVSQFTVPVMGGWFWNAMIHQKCVFIGFITTGDTPINLAVATGGGTVAAFEMGFPVVSQI